MKRLKLFLPLLLFIPLGLLLMKGLQLDPQVLPSALLDKPMPAFSLPSLDDADAVCQPSPPGRVSATRVQPRATS